MKILKNDISSQNNFPRNSIKDRINFFSSKANEAEKQKNIYSSKKDNSNNNKVRYSCIINNSYEKSMNNIINNIEKKANNPNKNNKEKEINKTINNIEKKENNPIKDNKEKEINKTINIIEKKDINPIKDNKEKELNKTNNNIEKKENNPIKNNKEKELNKNINKVEISPKIEDNDNLNRTKSVAITSQDNVNNNNENLKKELSIKISKQQKDDNQNLKKEQTIKISNQQRVDNENLKKEKSITNPNQQIVANDNLNRPQSISIQHTVENDNLNRTKSIFLFKGNKITNFIKEKINKITNRNKNQNNTNNNTNKSQIINKKEPLSNNIQNKNKTEEKSISNLQNKKLNEENREKSISNVQNKNPTEEKPQSKIQNKKQNEEKLFSNSNNIQNEKLSEEKPPSNTTQIKKQNDEKPSSNNIQNKKQQIEKKPSSVIQNKKLIEEKLISKIQNKKQNEEKPSSNIESKKQPEEKPSSNTIQNKKQQIEEKPSSIIENKQIMEEKFISDLQNKKQNDEKASSIIENKNPTEEKSSSNIIQNKNPTEEKPSSNIIQNEKQSEEKPSSNTIQNKKQQNDEKPSSIKQNKKLIEEKLISKLQNKKQNDEKPSGVQNIKQPEEKPSSNTIQNKKPTEEELISNIQNKNQNEEKPSNIQNKKQTEEKPSSNNIQKPSSIMQNKQIMEEKLISNLQNRKQNDEKPSSSIENKNPTEEKPSSNNAQNKKQQIEEKPSSIIQNKKLIEEKLLSNKQNKKQPEEKTSPNKTQNKKHFGIKIGEKVNNELKTKSSKELGKILVKSPSSNLKINNNLKKTLPQLSTKEMEHIKNIDDSQSTSISSNRSSVTELILDSINYDAYLEQQDTNVNQNKKENLNIKERETFCEGFFIASFPKENGKVIENSFSFRAPCGHIKCAKLPAMKPEIIMRYPLKDTNNLEINNLAASICFPTGIKVCYFENNPTIMKDYVTPITNQKGERYYMMTYHFFNKMSNSEFTKSYEENPLKHHLRRFGEAYINFRGEELTEKMVNEIQETLKFCEELGFKDYVYIPYCLCLISKYPYINEMEKCLQSIYYLMVNQINDSKIELNKLIMFLIHSVPIPLTRNSKLKFYIPYYNNGIEIACPKLNDISIINFNVSMLFKWFSIDNIITILRLILFEKKILFIDDNYERLSNVIDIFISLIYPFKWMHTYIPIMSEEMINYIETFLPFVNGIHNSLLYLIKNLIKENSSETASNSSSNSDSENDDVFFLIYITENRIGLSSEFKNKFRDVKNFIQDNIPGLPQILEKELYNKLKKIKKEIDLYINPNSNNIKTNSNINKNKVQDLSRYDLKIKNFFIEFFVDMLSGFHKYLALLDNNDVAFNKKLFINEKQIQDKKFYEEFIDTQIFQQFIQTVTINDDYNYFKTMLFHNKTYTKYLSNNYNNKNDSYYYVIPDSFETTNNDIKKIKKILTEECYVNDIQINDNGILPNTKRIIISIKSIDKDKYINKNCSIYLLPQFKNNNNIYNDKEMEKLNINFLKKFENYKPDIETINETDEIPENSSKIKLNLNQNQEHMTEKEIDDLEEYIKDFTIKLFSSEKLNIYNPKLKTEIQNSISNSYGRKYFINLLLKNISNNNLIILEYSYFNFLGSLIYNLIISSLKIEETDEILEQIIFLIKSTNFFGKKEYDKHGINIITLWEIYKPKIQMNPKVFQINFWNKWYEIEYENAEEKTEKEMQEIIYRMCDSMICLELPKSFIKNVLKGLANKLFGKDSQKSKDTFNVFIQKIVNAKYVSQALI